ncbi:centromere/kinetochore protein zw10 homolog [Aplysia californica]|uniref:Centromere/kinetochore protein zw10 homolog n=1 Tax=Aplysia californica TaxID=6500 RepID=A0ABM0JUY0_APLCA|nr:centromere/kinetochore protein zw10 homolog [Aplysia californica]
MSSFVAKVLEHAGQMEKKAVHVQLDVLLDKLSGLEVEVHQLVENKYSRFLPTLNAAEDLSHTVHQVHSDLASVESKINSEIKGQLSVSTGEFQSLNQQLTEAKTKLAALNYLVEIQDLLQNFSAAVSTKRYSEAAVAVRQLEVLLQQPLSEHDDQISILKEMRVELTILKETLHRALTDAWTDSVRWNVQGGKLSSSQVGRDVVGKTEEVCLAVSCVGEGAQVLAETVEGLYMTQSLAGKMKTFTEHVQAQMFPYILERSDFVIDLKPSSSVQTLKISVPDKSGSGGNSKNRKPAGNEDEVHYRTVFSNVLALLEHLHKMFLHLGFGWQAAHETSLSSSLSPSVTRDASEMETESSQVATVTGKGTLMSLLGQEVSPWLLDQLCRTVIAKAVPSSAKDLEGFNEVITSTGLLQNKLIELGFIQPDNKTLPDYVQNVNALFASKKCQTLLEEARELMTASLHDSVALPEDKPVGEWPPLLPGGVKKSKRMEAAGGELSENTLRLPKCRISTTVECLVRTAYETLQEATESSPECATQMYYAVRGLFEIFCLVVPKHHSQSLETFPQVAALHHNNCMYVAHHFLTLAHQFAPRLPATIVPTFVDLIHPIRQSGCEAFRRQLSHQRALLLESLDGAEGFANVEEAANREQSERAIKQVLLQLEHLQKVWKPVLPIDVYKKSMGKLTSAVVERITDCVSLLEDIAQEAGQVLLALLSPLEEEAGRFLTSPGEVPAAELLRFVPGWPRLSELKVVLEASLQDISDRWAEGKGPLALAYSPNEVKQMIRALFQNTSRRSAVLASIR